MFGNIATALVTAAILGIAGWAMGIFEAGSAAIDKEQIRSVMEEVMKTTINGETKTYGEVLSILSTNDAVILTEIGHLKDDIGDIEDSLDILTAP
jgi:hypothetical protein